jgi:Ca-activated chloride channel family protein
MQSGGALEVSWTGPGNRADHIAVAAPGDPPQQSHQYRYTRDGSTVVMDAPEEPGNYELRYIQGQSYTVLATRELRVLPVTATLTAPAEIPSGGALEVSWTGPGNRVDHVAVAAPGDPPQSSHQYRYTRDGSTLTLDAPEAPGRYEIRYIQGQSYQVLATRELRVLPVTATLEAAAQVSAGSRFEVSWTGPGNRVDHVAIAAAGSPQDQPLTYYVYTRDGNPLTLVAPETPGRYELRYVQGQSYTVLATRPLKVTR